MSQSPTCIPKFALYISRPFLHVDHCVTSVNINFTLNLTQGVFIDRIYSINHTETWNFNAPTLVTSVSHKIMAKCGILCPETLLLTEKQLHTIQFFIATRNVCPLAIPKSCAQNMSIRLLENHSLQRFLNRVCFTESIKYRGRKHCKAFQTISWLTQRTACINCHSPLYGRVCLFLL